MIYITGLTETVNPVIFFHKKAKTEKISSEISPFKANFYSDLCFLNNYLLAVIITALGAKSVRSLELTAV